MYVQYIIWQDLIHKNIVRKVQRKQRENYARKEKKKVWFGIFAWTAIDTICPETFLPVIFQGTVDIIS